MRYGLGMDSSYDIQTHQSEHHPSQRGLFEIRDRKSGIIGSWIYYNCVRGCNPNLKVCKVRIVASGTFRCTIP
jgi:hypothetical protein